MRISKKVVAQLRNRAIKERLEYLREQIENENISYGEITELQSLAKYIDKSDVVLLEWAGVPEKKECNHFIVRDDYGKEYCQECGKYNELS